MAKPKISATFNAVDKITGPVKKMNRSVTGFSKSAQRSFRGVGPSISKLRGLLTGVVAILATGAIARGITKFAEAGDEIAKTARQIGLTSEALQELRFAAERQGITTQDFTKSIQQMNKFVGQARVQTGALYTMLNKSNPALLEQLKTVENSEDAFNILVTELNSMKNQMDKSALANAAFGRSGTGFLIMAENGVEGISALREEARKYGNIISNEAAKKSEEFVDSMTNLKSTMNSLKNNALTPLIEKLQPLVQNMADYISKNQDMINLRIKQVFDGIRKAVQILVKLWDSGLIPAILVGIGVFKGLTIAIAIYKGVLTIAKGVQIAFNAVMAANPIGLIIIAIAALVAAVIYLIRNWDKVIAGFKAGWEIMKLIGNFIKDVFMFQINKLVEGFKIIWETIKTGWQAVKDFFLKIWEKIKEPFQKIGDFFKQFGGKKTEVNINENQTGGQPSLIGRNDGIMESRSYAENKSTVDINMAGLPQGSTVRQRGIAPGVRMNYGYAGGQV